VLRLLGKRSVRVAPVDLSISLLFCAHNERECLPEKLDNLRQLKARRPDLQILVYDDCSTDGSAELLASEPELLTLVRGKTRCGKAAGMKRLVAGATGDILFFTDANVLLSPDVMDRALPYYADSEVGGLNCTIKMESDSASATSQVGSSYAALDDRLQQLESETGNVMGATGGLFSIRRELYPQFPDTVQDDFTVSMSVIFQGRRLIKARDVIAHEKTVTRQREELRRKIRIGARAYYTHAFLRPQLRLMSFRDKFKYVSRKMLRWFGGFFLALAGIFAFGAIVTISAPLAGIVAFVALAATAVSVGANSGYLANARELVLATFATLIGVLQGMSGRTMATWSPSKSR
jgi:cellulose synthase/poly-beta-1,6-N-acetylglucosamine synthase-like glycosyltransferase